MSDPQARRRLWSHLRLVVLDVETTRAPSGPPRIVSIAAVVCAAGAPTGTWSQPILDPGCPIDAVSSGIHRITDEQVRGAPSFASVVAGLTALLVAGPDERLVLVAHQASFDVPVVREEMTRVRAVLPDLPVMDTMALMTLAGVVGAGGRRTLPALAVALGITLDAHHTAIADAQATALAACALLDRLADAGHDDADALLATLGGQRSGALRLSVPGGSGRPAEPTLPEEHLATHGTVLAARPGKRALAAWLSASDACAALRCPLLADRVAAALLPPADLLVALLPRLRAAIASGPPGAAATLLGAMLPLLPSIPPLATGDARHARRAAAAAFDDDLGAALDRLARCLPETACPACRRDAPCPRDTWRLALAPAVLPEGTAHKQPVFLHVGGSVGPKGAYLSLLATGHQRLADAALRLDHASWVVRGQGSIAANLARTAIDDGCLDPAIAARHAAALAAPGRHDDLCAGLALCDRILATRDGSTDPAWRDLHTQRAYLDGRLARLRDDGTRRHHPTVPRARPLRFHPKTREAPTADDAQADRVASTS